MTTPRDRVKELRWVKASELIPNPRNWREHPKAQQDALRGVLDEVGIADAVIARETAAGLELIDGHLRQDILGDAPVPVLVVDVTDEEADKLLVTLDPLVLMANANQDNLLALLESVSFRSQPINAMLEALANGERQPLVNLYDTQTDPLTEWQGMPEFEQEDQLAWKSVIVHFANADDLQAFARLIGQSLTEHTRSIWHPKAEIESYVDKRYVSNES